MTSVLPSTTTATTTSPNRLELESRREQKSFESKYNFRDLLKTHTVVLNGTDANAKRSEIREYFHKTFTCYERLFEVFVSDSVFYKQPDQLRHPLVFYYGHTAVFFINKLKLAKIIPDRIDPKMESTCAVGVDEMSWDDLNPAHYDWPTIDAIRAYRVKARALVDNLIMTLPLSLPITWDSPWWIILMGCEHERIHLETSSVLIRQLPITDVRPHGMWTTCADFRTAIEGVPKNSLISVNDGKIVKGKNRETHPLYGWDNEYGVPHTENVAGFGASKYLVSHAEYYEFMQDRGYETQEYWTEEGWRWRSYKKAVAPLFWVDTREVKEEKRKAMATDSCPYIFRNMLGEQPIPWDWPVETNYLEAKAFCNWKSKKTGKKIRLPTESEWTLLRDVAYPDNSEGTNDQAWWTTAPGNINLEFWASSCAVDRFQFGNGFFDIMGNVWQHNETPINAFKGFQVHRYYDDFSVPTFDNRHNLIKGGSWIATGNEATRLSRYAFRRHFFQHAGFRYVESALEAVIPDHKDMFEREPVLSQFCDLHYGKTHHFGVPNYPTAVANLAMDAYRQVRGEEARQQKAEEAKEADQKQRSPRVVQDEKTANSRINETRDLKHVEGKRRALDIGCAVGRTTWELARSNEFDQVLGLDCTTMYIRVATTLQKNGVVQYALKHEGDIETYHDIDLADLKLEPFADRVDFLQSDACNLDQKYGDFDLIVASNLITSLYDPRGFLSNIHKRLRKNGIFVVSSTYDWNVEFTPKNAWLGGYKESAENVTSLDGIEKCLSAHFTLIGKPKDLPLVTKREGRHWDYAISQVTIWKRKDDEQTN